MVRVAVEIEVTDPSLYICMRYTNIICISDYRSEQIIAARRRGSPVDWPEGKSIFIILILILYIIIPGLQGQTITRALSSLQLFRLGGTKKTKKANSIG